jgi:hypothetical protein
MLRTHGADISADSSLRLRHLEIEARILRLFAAVTVLVLAASAYQLYDVYSCLSGTGRRALVGWAIIGGEGHFPQRVLRAPAFSETSVPFSCLQLVMTFGCIVLFWNNPVSESPPEEPHPDAFGPGAGLATADCSSSASSSWASSARAGRDEPRDPLLPG